MSLALSSAAPTLEDARRAAEAVAGAGASRVLLYGSLARGQQAPGSDIDLVAIFDDLDYPTRWERKSELQRLAGEAAGCAVDVRVTDWPEWSIRSETVSTSFESRIAADAVVLCPGEPRGVNWDKEIGLPTTNEGEAAASLTNACDALIGIGGGLHPYPAEQAALDEADADEYLALLARRMRSVCSDAQAAMENSLKSMIHRRGAAAPPRTHELADLIAALSPRDRAAADACLGHLEPADVSIWRQQATYPGDFPETPLGALVSLAHRMATAAAHLGAHTADSISPTKPAASPQPPQADNLTDPSSGSTAANRARRYASRILNLLDTWNLKADTPTAIMGRPPPPEPAPR